VIASANECLENEWCCSWYNQLYDDDDDDDAHKPRMRLASSYINSIAPNMVWVINVLLFEITVHKHIMLLWETKEKLVYRFKCLLIVNITTIGVNWSVHRRQGLLTQSRAGHTSWLSFGVAYIIINRPAIPWHHCMIYPVLTICFISFHSMA